MCPLLFWSSLPLQITPPCKEAHPQATRKVSTELFVITNGILSLMPILPLMLISQTYHRTMRSDCSKPCPTCPWTLPWIWHPQFLWAVCAIVSITPLHYAQLLLTGDYNAQCVDTQWQNKIIFATRMYMHCTAADYQLVRSLRQRFNVCKAKALGREVSNLRENQDVFTRRNTWHRSSNSDNFLFWSILGNFLLRFMETWCFSFPSSLTWPYEN